MYSESLARAPDEPRLPIGHSATANGTPNPKIKGRPTSKADRISPQGKSGAGSKCRPTAFFICSVDVVS